MMNRKFTRTFLALALTGGVAGCEVSDFGLQQEDASIKSEKTLQPDYDKAEVASVRFEGQATPLDNKLFAMQAASGGRLEVQTAKLAEQKSNNLLIRRFAARLIAEHQQSNDQLTALAQPRSITIPDAMLPEQQKVYDNLADLKDTDFDRQFLELQIQAHKDAILLFEGASNQIQDEQLRTFASDKLPTLREHLKMAQDYLQNLGPAVH